MQHFINYFSFAESQLKQKALTLYRCQHNVSVCDVCYKEKSYCAAKQLSLL